jgi:hypothetical protein
MLFTISSPESVIPQWSYLYRQPGNGQGTEICVEAVPPIEILSLEKLHFRRNCKGTEEESEAYTLTDRNTHKHHGGTEANGKQTCHVVKNGICSSTCIHIANFPNMNNIFSCTAMLYMCGDVPLRNFFWSTVVIKTHLYLSDVKLSP